ncbi:MAG: 2-dehydro-3-deoxygalactonokinase [Burkholderiales bacterium]|nr:MAG: 2-dehydro-3-deoxygalactonokinase [Burkholderiales bacterium]
MQTQGAGSGAGQGVIAIDWGSSRLRAWLIDADGTIRDRRASDHGAIGLPAARFDAVLAETVGDWAAARPAAPLLACGMVGARGAWVEAPYVDLPAGVDAIRDRLVAVPTSLGRPLSIVGGLRTREPDVLRGEETQALGTGLSDGLLCMPGTHAKWLRLRGGVVDAFGTWFTGELYELLGSHGSLAKAFGETAPLDESAFDAGVARALEPDADASWLHVLFTFRSRVVGQGSPGAAERSRLSGWLLGTELRQALAGPFGAPDADRGLPLVLVADPRLAGLYERTLPAVREALEPALRERLPAAFVRADADCAARGLYRIATGA